jgi:hypothetical protein
MVHSYKCKDSCVRTVGKPWLPDPGQGEVKIYSHVGPVYSGRSTRYSTVQYVKHTL